MNPKYHESAEWKRRWAAALRLRRRVSKAQKDIRQIDADAEKKKEAPIKRIHQAQQRCEHLSVVGDAYDTRCEHCLKANPR